MSNPLRIANSNWADGSAPPASSWSGSAASWSPSRSEAGRAIRWGGSSFGPGSSLASLSDSSVSGTWVRMGFSCPTTGLGLNTAGSGLRSASLGDPSLWGLGVDADFRCGRGGSVRTPVSPVPPSLWIGTAAPGWSDELRDERLGPRPCSSPLTDREWAVLLSLLVVRGRLRKSRTALLVSRGLLRGLTLRGGGRCGGVLGPAARLPPLPGLSRLPPDLDSSDSSLRSDDDDSIRGRFAAPPPRSCRRLPRPRGRGVLSTTVSLSRALLHESCPLVVSSEPESESLDLICVNDPGSSPSVCVISPSSGPEPSCSLPARSDSVGVTSRSGVVPLMCGRWMVDGGPGCSPST